MIIKNYTLGLSLFILLLNASLRSQTHEDLINDLYSKNALDVMSAIYTIVEEDIYEALPAINEVFDSQPPFLQISFLNAMLDLNDPQVEAKAFEVISRADSFANYDPLLSYDPLKAKVEATFVLIHKQNYSTVNYIFDIIERDGISKIDPTAFVSLDIILNNVPAFEIKTKDILIQIWDNGKDDSHRYFSMWSLCEKYGVEMQSRIIYSFQNDIDLPTRFLALEYLFKQKYAGLNSLLKTQLIQDRTGVFRTAIADSLLQKFGEPSDLKAVIDYQPNEPDETARSLMGYAIDDFIPPKPDSLNWSGLVTKLLSYTDELFQYGWIKNEETRNYYIHKLNAVNKAIENDSPTAEACIIINEQMLPQVEQDLKTELITTEGYKYLHYYTINIKDEIEKEFGACQ